MRKSALLKYKTEIKRRARAGERYQDIARSFVVCVDTMRRFMKKYRIKWGEKK